MIHVTEAVGYLASLLVFLTFYTKTMIPLRIVGICSNFAFIAYGYLGALYPVLILHLILLPLNLLRLREMLRLTKQVREAAQSDLKMDWLKPFASSRRMSAGEVLFRKGDAASAIYFIVSGRCHLGALGIDILPGQVLGELALLAPDQTRTQTVECTENGEVMQITYEQVKQLYYQNPQFGFYFLQRQLSRRSLWQTRTVIQDLRAHLNFGSVIYTRLQCFLSRSAMKFNRCCYGSSEAVSTQTLKHCRINCKSGCVHLRTSLIIERSL